MTKAEVEVITSERRRRQWSRAEKERIVAAALEPGATILGVARELAASAAPLIRILVPLSSSISISPGIKGAAVSGAAATATRTNPDAGVAALPHSSCRQRKTWLARIAEHPAQRIDELLPWNWRSGAAPARAA